MTEKREILPESFLEMVLETLENPEHLANPGQGYKFMEDGSLVVPTVVLGGGLLYEKVDGGYVPHVVAYPKKDAVVTNVTQEGLKDRLYTGISLDTCFIQCMRNTSDWHEVIEDEGYKTSLIEMYLEGCEQIKSESSKI